MNLSELSPSFWISVFCIGFLILYWLGHVLYRTSSSLDERFDRWLKKLTKGSCFDYSLWYTILFGTIFVSCFSSLIYLFAYIFNLDISQLVDIFANKKVIFAAIFLKLGILSYPAVFLFTHAKYASKYIELNRTYDLIMKEGASESKANKGFYSWQVSLIEDIYFCRMEEHPQFSEFISSALDTHEVVKDVKQLASYKQKNSKLKEFLDKKIGDIYPLTHPITRLAASIP